MSVHVLLLFAIIGGNRIVRPAKPLSVMLLETVPPEIVKPPPPPLPPAKHHQAPAREGAAPPLRDIEVVPRTDILATVIDNALPVLAAGGKPEGSGTAGTGNKGEGTGAGKAPVKVRAIVDPANCERPILPDYAQRRHFVGHVILALLIDVDGKIKDVRLARSSGIPILDQTAMESARQCHFVAATIDKVPTPSWEPFRYSWTDQ